MTDNITQIINRKTVGLDRLESFDASGNPGPGVTAGMAFAKVKQLSGEVRHLTEVNNKLREQIGMLQSELEIQR